MKRLLSAVAAIALFATALGILMVVYLFQRSGNPAMLWSTSPAVGFVIGRLIRFLLNEFACLLLIIAIFNDIRYLRIGWRLFLIELFVLLPVYFVLKLLVEGDSEISSPLLAQIHRMVVNPLLMVILIIGLFLQKHLVLTSRK